MKKSVMLNSAIAFLIVGLLGVQVGCENQEKLAQSDVKVWVRKPDTAKQCQQTDSVGKMRSELEAQGIQVYATQQKSNGLAMIAMCGAPTGQFNHFEISGQQLEKAKALGFEKVDPTDLE